ncbi:MAG: hypothetical protein IH840_12425 [Candidatus Heimdallarchaeota archaeon]|nr:hypothetical protein [Candidatus Heimdallarchaeota archaeon]
MTRIRFLKNRYVKLPSGIAYILLFYFASAYGIGITLVLAYLYFSILLELTPLLVIVVGIQISVIPVGLWYGLRNSSGEKLSFLRTSMRFLTPLGIGFVISGFLKDNEFILGVILYNLLILVLYYGLIFTFYYKPAHKIYTNYMSKTTEERS